MKALSLVCFSALATAYCAGGAVLGTRDDDDGPDDESLAAPVEGRVAPNMELIVGVCGSVALLLVATLGTLACVFCRGKAADGAECRLDYRTGSKVSIGSNANPNMQSLPPTGMESTIALADGASDASFARRNGSMVQQNTLTVLHPDRGEPGLHHVKAPVKVFRRNESGGSFMSNTSEDVIAAPELSDSEQFGSGVGFLDERGNPVVRDEPCSGDNSEEDDQHPMAYRIGR